MNILASLISPLRCGFLPPMRRVGGLPVSGITGGRRPTINPLRGVAPDGEAAMSPIRRAGVVPPGAAGRLTK
jgi:hypothetical protein